MRRCCVISVLLLAAAAAAPAGDKGKFKPYRAGILGERVHVRAGPSRNYTSLKLVSAGDQVWVTGGKGDWAQIDVPADCAVYISSGLVGRDGDVGMVKGERCNVRARPKATADVLGQVSQGTALEVLGAEGDWLKIRPPKGVHAWMSARYVDPPPPGASVKK